METDENALIIFYVKQKQIQYNFFKVLIFKIMIISQENETEALYFLSSDLECNSVVVRDRMGESVCRRWISGDFHNFKFAATFLSRNLKV